MVWRWDILDTGWWRLRCQKRGRDKWRFINDIIFLGINKGIWFWCSEGGDTEGCCTRGGYRRQMLATPKGNVWKENNIMKWFICLFIWFGFWQFWLSVEAPRTHTSIFILKTFLIDIRWEEQPKIELRLISYSNKINVFTQNCFIFFYFCVF